MPLGELEPLFIPTFCVLAKIEATILYVGLEVKRTILPNTLLGFEIHMD